MSKVGIATLPLHGSKAPYWLLKRMVKLGKPIFDILYDMEGADGIIRRLSNTYWFQGLACILGFDWHSSGCTTVLGGVLKQIITADGHGLIIAGGKGKNSNRVKNHLTQQAKELDYCEDDVKRLNETSRLVAKIDNAAIQDGFNLYHHLMIVSENHWGIIQQGLDKKINKARRYHWISENLSDFLNDPHSDISSELFRKHTLNMATNKSKECRKVSLDLIAEGPNRLKRYLNKIKDRNQLSIYDFADSKKAIKLEKIPHLNMPIPFTLKWECIEMAKDLANKDYIDLLLTRGLGPGMIRALALISEFIWGVPASWKDPAKYSFAVGGKDGIPYPVNLQRMEKCVYLLRDAIDQARINKNEKLNALKRLHNFKRRKSLL
ncbi:MAG: DUF763 domain-containing protein [Candidatus Lokiarchaeota archaeon]|nr:DUF763 domain-containing protein [Candidatus Lokiarchaeota archaeon]MBD3339441.1 DUF763 domain-containing protein [Candidatus Lokiarchaeota archaeon]